MKFCVLILLIAAVNCQEVHDCDAGFLYKEATKTCEPNPNLVDGEIKEEKCCRFEGNNVLDKEVKTFTSTWGKTKIQGEDFEFDPKLASDDLTYINIVFCAFCQYLPIKVYKSFPNILAIDAKDTEIKKLTKANFEKLNKIEYLKLEYNHIGSVDDDTFDDLLQLRFLSLFKNKLKTFDSRVVKNNLNLESLSIGANELTTIPDLTHLTKLEKLVISANHLVTVDPVFNFPNLKKLDMVGDHLTSLPKGVFDNLPELEKIDLSSNKIKALDEEIFKNNNKLKEIDLSWNGLKTFSVQAFTKKPKLSNVNLMGSDLGSNYCEDPILANIWIARC